MVEAILIGNLGMLAYKQLKNNATRWIAIRGKSELLGIVATSSSISQIEKKLKKLMVYSLGPLLDYFSQGSVVPSSNFRRNFRNIQWCIEQGLKIAAEYSGKKWHNKMLFSSKTNSELQSLLEEANLGYKNLNNLYNSEILVALDGFRKETIYYMKEGVRNKKNLRNKLIEEEKDSEDFEKFLEHGLSYQMTKQEKTIEEDLGKSNPKVDKILREFFIKLEKNQNFGVLGIHNIPCDSCGRDKFYGHRYKCLSCADYNLCNDCYEQGNVTKGHKLSHVCLLIPTPFEEKPGHMEYEKILNLLIETNQFFAKSESFMNNDRNCDYCFQDITGIIFKASTQCLFDICKACRDTLKNTKNMNDNTIKRILHKSTSVDYEDYLYKKMKANQGEDKTQEEIKKEANLQSKFIQSLTLTGEEKIYAMLPNGEEFEEQWYGLLELKKNIPIPEYLQENYRKVGKIILKEGPIDGKCFHIIKIPEETSGGNMKTKISRNISLGIDIKSNYIANYDGYAFNKYKNPSKNNIIQPERSVTLSFPKFAHSLLDSIDNLSYIRKLSMLIQVTTAIQKIHKLGLVHGNLRPGSIYLEKVQGLHNTIVPRIGDFLPFLTGSRNISANTDVRNSREKDNLLWLNNIANTDDDGKKYVAPEWKTSNCNIYIYIYIDKQLEKCGEKIDIYSLGQIIREVFIKDKSNPKYTRKELFYGVVKHCIAKMPENRPDAKEILEYLRKFESDINQKMMKPSEVVKRKTYKMKIPKLNIKFEEAYKKALRKHFSFRHK